MKKTADYPRRLDWRKIKNIAPLLRLTNSELKTKALNVVSLIRSILSYHKEQGIELMSKLRKREVTEVEFQRLSDVEMKRATDEIDSKATVDAIMIFDELNRRVPTTAKGQLGLPPQLRSADKRDPNLSMNRIAVSIGSEFGTAPLLANNIEELAKALPY